LPPASWSVRLSTYQILEKKMADITEAPRATSYNAYKLAWGAALIFYFCEYVARSAPAVMVPELTTAFRVDAVGVSAIIGAYYYTYSVMSLLAGAALDRFGAKFPLPLGAVVLGLGCLMFTIPVPAVGYSGRLLQGGGLRVRVHRRGLPRNSWLFGPRAGNGGRVHTMLWDAWRLGRAGGGWTADPFAAGLEGVLG
jgi:MFS family permease